MRSPLCLHRDRTTDFSSAPHLPYLAGKVRISGIRRCAVHVVGLTFDCTCEQSRATPGFLGSILPSLGRILPETDRGTRVMVGVEADVVDARWWT